MRSILPFVVALSALTACGEELLETPGPSFELTDAALAASFNTELKKKPENARSVYGESFTVEATVSREGGDGPVEVTAYLAPLSGTTYGRYGAVTVTGANGVLRVSADTLSSARVRFTKRGFGTVRVDWRVIIEPNVSDKPDGAPVPEYRLEISEVSE